LNKKIILVAILLAILLLAGCYTKIPIEQENYIGEWKYTQQINDSITEKEKSIIITISEDGKGNYKESETENGHSISSSISSFPVIIEKDKINLKIFDFGKELKIDREPFLENQKWYMTINGKTFEKQ